MAPLMAFFLHMYQPPLPIQTFDVLMRIINNSYIPLTETLLQTNHKITVNINSSLTEMLKEHGPKVIENLSLLAERGQIEFLESGAYHPIFPLISKKDVESQIKINHKINKDCFGKYYNPEGVFPPELALNFDVTKQLSELNYKYVVASEPTFTNLSFRNLPYIELESKKMYIIRRVRYLSNDLAFRKYNDPLDFVNSIIQFENSENKDQQVIPILGMDWETFGEHHNDYIPFLMKCMDLVKPITLGDYLLEMKNNNSLLNIDNAQMFNASSWSTDQHDIEKKIPYPLWDNPSNSLHQLILTLMEVLEQAVNFIDTNKTPTDFYKSQQSCQLWWCAENRFGPEIVKRAINFQLQTLKEIKLIINQENNFEKKNAVEKLITIADNIINRINHIMEMKK